MSDPRPDFWQSGLPFISDADGKKINWIQVSLFGLATILSSFFSSVADVVAKLWNVVIIDRARDISAAYSSYVETIFAEGTAALSFANATSLAGDSGLIGAVALVAVGGYLIAWIVGVIRSE